MGLSSREVLGTLTRADRLPRTRAKSNTVYTIGYADLGGSDQPVVQVP